MHISSRFSSLPLTLTVVLGTISIVHGQTGVLTNASAASYGPIVAPGSIVSAWGNNFSTATVSGVVGGTGSGPTLPTSLANVTLTVTTSSQAAVSPMLYLVSPGQINYVLPGSTGLGAATVSLMSPNGTLQGPVLVSNIAPALFTVDGSGAGAPAAQVLTVNGAGQQSVAFLGSNSIPLKNSGGSNTYLILYGTGIRNHTLNPVIASIGGTQVPVLYAGPQGPYPGLDQVNLGPLPMSLAGAGAVNLVITVDGAPANTTQVTIQ
jgi:uncharacterized protein (TIGR03437 family)